MQHKIDNELRKSILNPYLTQVAVGIVLTAFLLLLGTISLYLYHFRGAFSVEQEEWGQFGDFLGGTINPILSFLSLLALVLTLILQRKQVEMQRIELENSKQELQATRNEMIHSRKIAEEQVAHFKTEAQRSDVFKTIQVLEARLESLYREPIYFISGGKLRRRELYFTLSFATQDALKQIIAPEVSPPVEFEDQLVQTKSVLMQLHLTIVKLSMQLTLLTQLEDSDAVLFFYEPTLNHLATKLKEVGYLPENDEMAMKMNAEMRKNIIDSRRIAKMHQYANAKN